MWKVWDSKHIPLNAPQLEDWCEKLLETIGDDPIGTVTYARKGDRLLAASRTKGGNIAVFNCQIQAVQVFQHVTIEEGDDEPGPTLKLVE